MMIYRSIMLGAVVFGATFGMQGLIQAQTAPNQQEVTASLPQLSQQQGPLMVAVRLTDVPLAIKVGANAKRVGSTMTIDQRKSYLATLQAKQDAVMTQVAALGGTELARVSKAYNALVVMVDAEKLPQVASISGVAAIRQVINFETTLSSTVPYTGAAALQNTGLTGAGVKVAILDSGIDYTHRNLGGSGLPADFAAASAAATTIPTGLYPTAKVIGGYDFVGETWPNGALAPDPNPIDAGTGAGHGTHVADIAAGSSLDGTHKGMAPGAKLYAVKVCSSVSSRCSGLAILQGLDWVIDPNGDLDFSDAPDVLNMSLGASYGQRENPATEAVSNAVRFGIVAAISAGNSADRPFIVGSPSSAAEAISVAQTQMPNATLSPLTVSSPAFISGVYTNTATVNWAPIVNGFSGPVKLAGNTGTLASLACTLSNTIDFTNTVALIDRGNCAISLKVANAAAKGALGVLIANNVAGDAPTFSFGGGTPLVETLIVTQAIGNTLKDGVASGSAVNVSVNPTSAISLAGSMASTSSRGPGYNFATIKPEIGAPGASVSAVYGTGTGEGSFGGTSGAAPMVAGAAALLFQKFPTANAAEIKSRLMNTAERNVYTNAALLPGELAPITRIGAGELRVDRAAAANTGVWDATNPYSVSLSFGSLRVIGSKVLQKKVAVKNYSNTARTYTITRTFRYADDAASGAIILSAPASITVPAKGTAAFTLSLTIDANKLPAWIFNNGLNEGDGSLLQTMEFDGYLLLADGAETVSVPWHVLPHRASNVVASTAVSLGGTGSGTMGASNLGGAEAGAVEVFALTGTSPKFSTLQAPYGGGEVWVDLKAVGIRSVVDRGIPLIQFAISTYGERAHPANPAGFDVYVDTNNDGIDDYLIFNRERTGFAATGQTLAFVHKIGTSTATGFYFVNAELGSANMIYTVPASSLSFTDLSIPFSFSVSAYDNYLSGNLTDSIVSMSAAPGLPKFFLGSDSLTVPIGFSGSYPVSMPVGGAAASPSQTGFLLMHGNGLTDREASVVQVTP